MFSDSVQVTDVIVGKFANIVDMSPKIKILIKHNTITNTNTNTYLPICFNDNKPEKKTYFF